MTALSPPSSLRAQLVPRRPKGEAQHSMWRPAFEVFAPSPVRGSPSPVRGPDLVRGPELVRGHGASPVGPDSGASSSQWPRPPQPHPAAAEERLQGLLELAQVSGEGMSAALARVENERDAGRQQLTAAAALIERQRSELERNSVMVQANQQRADALRQALQLAEQQHARWPLPEQHAAWRHGTPPLDRQQVVREELATAMRRRRAPNPNPHPHPNPNPNPNPHPNPNPDPNPNPGCTLLAAPRPNASVSRRWRAPGVRVRVREGEGEGEGEG